MHLRASSRASSLVAASAVVAALAGATTGTAAPRAAVPPNPLTATLAKVKGLSPAAREAKLVELGKQEGGELALYTSLDLPISTRVVAAFEAAYPGIKVALTRSTSEILDARVLAEASAGAAGADVIETNGPDIFILQHKKNILVPYRGSPSAGAIPAKYRFDSWTADRLNNFVISWNTNLVQPGHEPKSLFELAQPKWKGKISLEASDVDWYAVVYQYYEQQQLSKLKHYKDPKLQARQKAKVDRNLDAVFAKLVDNAQVISGHVTQANLLAAGQFQVAVSQYAHTLEAIQAKKAPVSFRPFAGPVFSRPQGIGVVYRLRHPATALLFYDWLLRADGGQKVLLDAGSAPSHPSMRDPQLAGATIVPIDLRQVVSHWAEWSKRYDDLIH